MDINGAKVVPINLLRLAIVSQKKNIGSPELYMNDVKLDNVQLVNHLGHILTSDLSDDKDILHQTSMYNRKANAVL